MARTKSRHAYPQVLRTPRNTHCEYDHENKDDGHDDANRGAVIGRRRLANRLTPMPVMATEGDVDGSVESLLEATENLARRKDILTGGLALGRYFAEVRETGDGKEVELVVQYLRNPVQPVQLPVFSIYELFDCPSHICSIWQRHKLGHSIFTCVTAWSGHGETSLKLNFFY